MEKAKLLVKGLDVVCVIGCAEPERTAPQKIQLDVELEYDISKAAATDELKNAVNYVDVCARLRDECQEKKFRLVERLGRECCEMIFLNWPQVEKVKLEVRKIRIVPEANTVGLVIESTRDQSN